MDVQRIVGGVMVALVLGILAMLALAVYLDSGPEEEGMSRPETPKAPGVNPRRVG